MGSGSSGVTDGPPTWCLSLAHLAETGIQEKAVLMGAGELPARLWVGGVPGSLKVGLQQPEAVSAAGANLQGPAAGPTA